MYNIPDVIYIIFKKITRVFPARENILNHNVFIFFLLFRRNRHTILKKKNKNKKHAYPARENSLNHNVFIFSAITTPLILLYLYNI